MKKCLHFTEFKITDRGAVRCACGAKLRALDVLTSIIENGRVFTAGELRARDRKIRQAVR